MRVIYKHEISISDGVQTFNFGSDFKINHIGEQDERLMMWVDHLMNDSTRKFNLQVYGTGHKFNDGNGIHMQTVQMSNGLVWHIYDTGGRES